MARNATTGELLEAAIARLPASLETRRLDAELIIAHALGIPRARVRSHGEEPRTAQECERSLALIERRALGEPVAYLLGRREFWSLELEVGTDVLVPRPETELLVERALAVGPAGPAATADLGTGCGAIALALARERPGWRITATDASSGALAVARRNASALGLDNVELVEGDWLEPLAGRRFDLIVSNPPYLAGSDPALDAPPLSYEPRAALTPGADSLAALRTIIRDAPRHLVPGGRLLLEHGPAQSGRVARELVAQGFGHVRSHRDLAGHERVTEACLERP